MKPPTQETAFRLREGQTLPLSMQSFLAKKVSFVRTSPDLGLDGNIDSFIEAVPKLLAWNIELAGLFNSL